MRTRVTASLLAAASVSAALVAAAPPAAAQESTNPTGRPSCSAYPARDGAYGMRVSPAFTPSRPFKVNRGARVTLAARVFRNGQPCPDRPIGFYARGPFFIRNGQKVVPPYHLTGKDVSNGLGLAYTTVTAINDFRFFANYNVNAVTVGARAFSLVQIR